MKLRKKICSSFTLHVFDSLCTINQTFIASSHATSWPRTCPHDVISYFQDILLLQAYHDCMETLHRDTLHMLSICFLSLAVQDYTVASSFYKCFSPSFLTEGGVSGWWKEVSGNSAIAEGRTIIECQIKLCFFTMRTMHNCTFLMVN